MGGGVCVCVYRHIIIVGSRVLSVKVPRAQSYTKGRPAAEGEG